MLNVRPLWWVNDGGGEGGRKLCAILSEIITRTIEHIVQHWSAIRDEVHCHLESHVTLNIGME